MDRLENQAEAEINGLAEQIFSSKVVQVNHSSRDTVVLSLVDSLKKNAGNVVAQKLTFRSGVSVASLEQLRETLPLCPNITEMEFCCLPSTEALLGALQCAQTPFVKSLSLTSLAPWNRQNRGNQDVIADAIASKVLLPTGNCDTNCNACVLTSLEIVNYPLGAEGAHILARAMQGNTSLKVLRLQDCDLRSDCAAHIANMIRYNHSLEVLDLSYNRHYLGSPITREMTMKTLVKKGLRYNTTLLELQMRGETNINRRQLDLQLSMNRIKKKYQSDKVDPLSIPPSVWPLLLAKVSAKPNILHLFTQEGLVAILPFLRCTKDGP
jgi:hypothetical protein